jgi:hypothetical protein
MELDAAVGIVVTGREHLVADDGIDGELLEEFAHQASHERFPGITLAAGEFPIALEMDAGLAPCHEERSIAFDDRGRHDGRGHFGGVNG